MPYTPTGKYNDLEIQVIAVNSLLVFLSVLAVALRVWARRIQKVSFYADDWLIFIALVLALAINAILYYSIHVGVGLHTDTLQLETIQAYSLNLYILQLFWNTDLPIIKLSILLFLKRIFPVPSMKYACYGLMTFLLMWYIAFQAVAIFQCSPIDHDWLRTTTNGHCVDFIPFVITLATTNLATDVALMILPVRQIWNLQMRTTQKVGLSCTFAVGFIIVAIAIVRIDNVAHINIKDITWSDTYAHLWTAIESSLGVVVACIPHLMPVYRKVRGSTSVVGSYEKRASRTKSWSQGRGDSIAHKNVFSSAQHTSVSETDKDKESEDGMDLIGRPAHGIGVVTTLERHSEPNIGTAHLGEGQPEAIPMHAL